MARVFHGKLGRKGRKGMGTGVRLAACLGLVLLAGSGCIFGVYSKQDYGPGGAVLGVSQNQSLSDVVRIIGAPDKLYQVGDTQVLVYTKYEGTHILGLFSTVKKSDLVVLLKDGKVLQPPVLVPKGEALTILGVISAPIMGPAIEKEE